LLAYSSDRFNRGGPAYGQILREELRRAGVELHYAARGKVEATPEGEYFNNSEDAANKYWVDKIREASMRGRNRKATSGIHPGGGQPPYGYRREGKGDETHYIIIEEEAEIVRRIFNWYDEGISPIEIARRLRGVPTKSDNREKKVKRRAHGEWTANYIYPLLRNETYAGTAWVNKVQMVDGKEVPRPKEEWIAIPTPAIIDHALWERCQKRMEIGKQQSKRNSKYDYLMARRLKCSCGYSIAARPSQSKGVHFFYYYCLTSHKEGGTVAPKCGLRHFRVEHVDTLVWDFTVKLLSNRQAMLAALRESQRELRKRHAAVYERLDAVEHQITTNTTELERLARALAKEEDELFYNIVKREAESYLAVLKDLQAEKEKLLAIVHQAAITDEDIEQLDRFAAEVRSRLPHMTFAEKRRVIEALKFTGTLAEEEGEKVVYIHWHIHTWRFSLHTDLPSV
jgi:site-specific DNA recombinase